jgi:hypothetical protein
MVELARDLDELNLDGRLVVLEALGAAQRAAQARGGSGPDQAKAKAS